MNLFVLITGYFSYKRTYIKVNKVVGLILIMIFWGLLLSFVTVLWLVPQTIDLKLMIGIVETSLSQWFVVIYCILYLLIPFINKVINSINQNGFKLLLGIGLISFYIWPTVFTTTTVNDAGYGITNFINLYLVGAYIHKYHDKRNAVSRLLLIYLLVTILTTIFSFVAGRAWNYNSIFNLISSIALFSIFKSLHIKHNKIINRLARYTFSVYLIDVNGYFNKFLYRTIFHSNNYWNSSLMILNLIITILGIYIICIVLDWLRIVCLGKLFNYLSNRVTFRVES